jgi:hypothetical protein
MAVARGDLPSPDETHRTVGGRRLRDMDARAAGTRGATGVRLRSPVLLLFDDEVKRHWRPKAAASGTQLVLFTL